MLADQFGPGGDGCEDLAQTLGIDGQCAHGHVPVFGCEYHLLDGGHLHRYELARAGARARGAVVEATGPRSTAPGVISRGFEVDDPQYQREGKERTRAGDGAEDTGLGCAFWKPLTGEAETGCAEQGQQEPNNGGEDSRSPIKPCNGVEQLLRILVQWLDGDDRTKSAPLPGRNGGARDRNVPGEAPHPGAWHLLPESMIVGAARVWRGRDGRDHRGSMPRRSSAGAESSAMLAPELAGI